MVHFLTSKGYTPQEIEEALILAGVLEDQARMVLTALVPDIPEGYIRARDACEKYGISDALLGMWVGRDHVRTVKFGRKLSFVCEEDVKHRVEAMRVKVAV